MRRATPQGSRSTRRKAAETRKAFPRPVAAKADPVQPLSKQAAETVSPPLPELPAPQWFAADAAVVGHSHLRANPPKPCQDVALADAGGRALVILADGAGSAAVSHLGAAAVVAGIRRLCRTFEGDLALTLDSRNGAPGQAEALARRIVTHARGLLDDLAEAHLRSAEDFRCTLLLWVSGRQRALWLKIGDGELVAESDGACHCVGPAGKGEFANQTCFIGPRLQDSQWAWGEIEAIPLTGLAAMSDGGAERLVVSNARRVSLAVGKLLRGVAEAQVGRRELFGLLAEADFWKGTSGDDKSLALISRALSAP